MATLHSPTFKPAFRFDQAPKTFAALETCCTLRPIESDEAYEKALSVVHALVGFDLNADQAAYLHTLSLLVEEWEQDTFEASLPDLDPPHILRYLCQARDWSTADLVREMDGDNAVYKVLSGDRSPSKTQIEKFCQIFGVLADVFI